MMQNKNLVLGIIIALTLIVSGIFIWSNYQIEPQERLDKPIKLPPQTSKKCGIENCHGLDITCGPNVPDACNEMYAGGDNCRQLASCQTVDGQCKLANSPKFDSCKACVKKCEQDFPDDPTMFFECENKCIE